MYKLTDLPTRPATRLSAALGVFFLLLTGSVHVSAQAGNLDFSFNSTGNRLEAFGGGADEARAMAVQPDGKIVVAGYSHMGGSGYDFVVVRYDADGALDSTFGGGDGKVATSFGSGMTDDFAAAVAIQADGKIIVAGHSRQTGTWTDFALVRYNTDGSLDNTFDGDGRVTTPVGVGEVSDGASAVAIQSDGKIVAAGLAQMAGTGTDTAVVRYNADGSLDTTFDTDGKATTAVAPGGSWDSAYGMAIQADGKIVTAGYADGMSGGADFALVRFNSNGSLDTTFDVDGKVTTAVGPSTNVDQAWAVALQPDGKIVAAGKANMGASGDDFALVRYNTNGSLDATFDSDGKATTAIGPTSNADEARAVAIQTDGKIVAAGHASGMAGSGTDIALVRFNTNGSLDSSFDTDGRVTTAVGPATETDNAYALALLPDASIVVSGRADRIPDTGTDFALIRYTSGGALDSAFDSDGRITTDVGISSSLVYAVAAQADGKIVVAGYVNSPTSGQDFAVVRYNSDGSLDTTFDGDGKVTTTFSASPVPDVANAVAVQPDGKIIAAGYTGAFGAPEFALVRYNTDGSLDTSFDTDGKVITNVGTSVSFGNDEAYAIALQADGKIVVAGYASVSTGSLWELAVARYNTDGSLDTTFDGDGKTLIDISSTSNDIAYSVAVQADGKIVAAGIAGSAAGGSDFAVVRLNADGTLDTSFDTDGKVTTAISASTGYDEARAVAIQSDGKIVAVGRALNVVGSGADFALVRYNVDGSLDSTFDTDGIVTTAVGPTTSTDYAYAATIQADGKIVAAGYTSTGSGDLAFARYNSNGSLDTDFSGDGIATIDLGGNEAVLAMVSQGGNRVVAAGYGNGGYNFLTSRMWLSTVVTAAPVSVTGRVLDVYGRGIRGARVFLADETGASRYAMTNTFGYYTLTGVEAGRGYTIGASARRYVFPTRYLQVNEQMAAVDLFGRPGTAVTTVTAQDAQPQQRPAPISQPVPAPLSTPPPAKRKSIVPARIYKKKQAEL